MKRRCKKIILVVDETITDEDILNSLPPSVYDYVMNCYEQKTKIYIDID